MRQTRRPDAKNGIYLSIKRTGNGTDISKMKKSDAHADKASPEESDITPLIHFQMVFQCDECLQDAYMAAKHAAVGATI